MHSYAPGPISLVNRDVGIKLMPASIDPVLRRGVIDRVEEGVESLLAHDASQPHHVRFGLGPELVVPRAADDAFRVPEVVAPRRGESEVVGG